MDFIYLKINKSKKLTQTISLIRNFDVNLSMSEIKQKIDKGEVLITHDITALTDLVDEMNNIDLNEVFYQLVQDLINIGDEIELSDEFGEISIEQLRNSIESWNQIND